MQYESVISNINITSRSSLISLWKVPQNVCVLPPFHKKQVGRADHLCAGNEPKGEQQMKKTCAAWLSDSIFSLTVK